MYGYEPYILSIAYNMIFVKKVADSTYTIVMIISFSGIYAGYTAIG